MKFMLTLGVAIFRSSNLRESLSFSCSTVLITEGGVECGGDHTFPDSILCNVGTLKQ